MAVADYFLKIDGIKGESPDKAHKEEIQIESWSWGATQGGTFAYGGGGGAGKVSMQDFHFVKKYDKASPKLFEACASGKHIKEATLTCRKAGGRQEDFLFIKFSDVLISAYQTGGAGSSDVIPTDQISFNFSKIEFEYKEQKADGSVGGQVKAGYNLKEMQKV